MIRLDALLAWMDAQGLGDGLATEVEELAGGTQNLMLRFRRGGRGYVLRQPPTHAGAEGERTVRRESRILAALADTRVPHPRLIAVCLEPEVLGGAFYLMAAVDGFNAGVGLPPLHAGDPAIRRAMGFALIDGLLALGNVDHIAAGLANFGHPDGFLERQVPRWLRQLDSYHTHPGWPGPSSLPGVAEVARWLTDNRPATFMPGILHGDYHLSNVMFRPDGPELGAIIDWEMCTIGDPLLDLGWLLATRPEPGAVVDPNSPSAAWAGLPTNAEFLAHYVASSRRDLTAIDWYNVLACFKLGIILEGSHARACSGLMDRATGDRLHRRATGLLERARAVSLARVA